MGLNGKLQLKACGMWENALVKIFVKQKISPTKILEAKKVWKDIYFSKEQIWKDEPFQKEIMHIFPYTIINKI